MFFLRNHWLSVFLPIVLIGCASTSDVNRLDSRLNIVASQSERELNTQRSTQRALVKKIEDLEQQLNAIRSKTDTFCVVAKNGEFNQLHPKGSSVCNIR